MADLKIYNNGENKILFSAGDRIIRQPYEFGDAFQNRMGLNNYIEVEAPFPKYHTMAAWINTPRTNERNLLNFQNTNLDNYSLQAHLFAAQNRHFMGVFYNRSNSGGDATVTVSGLPSNVGDNTGLTFFVNDMRPSNLNNSRYNFATSSRQSSYPNDYDFNKIWIGAARLSAGEIPDQYNTTSRFNRIVVFNRNIEPVEVIRFFNNLLGGDLVSSEGLSIDIHNDKAEILNTGSGDFVGVRDYSGNNHHGKIMNLPAGTLQEQLDFANANLFVPFIS